MSKLWLIVAAGIAYGSLYPFDFSRPYPIEGIIAQLLNNALTRPSRGDVLANLLLYLPFGFVGAWALLRRFSGAGALTTVVMLGALLSLSIELAQAFTVGRTSSAFDLALNVISTSVGAVAAWLAGAVHQPVHADVRRYLHDPFATILAACWLAYRLVPFVPTIDFQHVKDAIRPLLAPGSFAPWTCARHLICWLAFAYLVRVALSSTVSKLALPIVGLAVVFAPIFIAGRVMRLEEVVAVGLASVLWLFLARSRATRPMLLVLLSAVIVSVELAPFDFSGNYRDFAWLPFSGFIKGTLEVGVFALFEKFFLYGTLIWLLVRSQCPIAPATIMVAVALLALEFAQLLTPDRSPELTDALMVILAGWMCALWSPKPQERAAFTSRPSPRGQPRR